MLTYEGLAPESTSALTNLQLIVKGKLYCPARLNSSQKQSWMSDATLISLSTTAFNYHFFTIVCRENSECMASNTGGGCPAESTRPRLIERAHLLVYFRSNAVTKALILNGKTWPSLFPPASRASASIYLDFTRLNQCRNLCLSIMWGSILNSYPLPEAYDVYEKRVNP
jgi:hypothetical protein